MNLSRIVSLSLLFAVIGCEKADFGDQAKAWVTNNARNYSEKLATADYEVRWERFFQKAIKGTGNTLVNSDQILGEVFERQRKLLEEFKTSDFQSIESLQLTHIRSQFLDVLIAMQLLEQSKRQLRFAFEEACSRQSFDNWGLWNVGSFSVLDSFRAMAHDAYHKNQETMGVVLFYTTGTDEEEQSQQEQDQQSFGDFIKSILPFYGTVFALINQEEIEEQKVILEEAIALFYDLVLDSDELYELSSGFCEESRQTYLTQSQDYSDNLESLMHSARSVYQVQRDLLEASERSLVRIKLAYVDQEFGVNEAFDKLFKEEIVFDNYRSLLALVQEKNLSQSKLRDITDDKSFENLKQWDQYEDQLRELLLLNRQLLASELMTPLQSRLKRLEGLLLTEWATLPAEMKEEFYSNSLEVSDAL